MDRLVWRIARGDAQVRVTEDGAIDGDPELAAEIAARLRELVIVTRRGTMPQADASAPDAITLEPGDGRYVVARVRILCEDSDFIILGCEWC